MSQPPRFPPSIEGKRWAQRAAAVPFGELAAVRATAGQWRNGLAALVTLLSAASLIASPTLADHLTGWSRLAVGVLALCGLLALLYGTWRAMDAAFGAPGPDDYLTGPRLQQYEHDQANAAVTALRAARSAFILGLLLTIAAAAIAFGLTRASGSLTSSAHSKPTPTVTRTVTITRTPTVTVTPNVIVTVIVTVPPPTVPGQG